MTFKSTAFFFAIGFINIVYGQTGADPLLVNTNAGPIRGLRASDGNYSMFLGIPYAKVNEVNHFGPALPYPAFEDTFEAYDSTTVCAQIDNRRFLGTVDCLRLQIYVPDSASSVNKLPVMIWIHGGAFLTGTSGTAAYGPKYLVRHDIILVAINYRLGAYGFMCLDTPDVPGNQGLKDQLAAVRWVKENIEAFGGNVDRITISGESAGSASVDLHLLSRHEKLYDKAIMESGAGISPGVVTEPDLNAATKIAESLGYVGDNKASLLYLSSINAETVLRAGTRLGIEFSPCVEKELENVEAFITDNPINIQAVKVRDMPILIGTNDDEMLFIYGHTDFTNYKDVFYDRLKAVFDLGDDLVEEARTVRKFYIGDAAISNAVKDKVIDFESDMMFLHPSQRSINNYLENGANAIYRYLFSYLGGRNYYKLTHHITFGGASHADELGYLFDSAALTEEPGIEDQLMIDRMTTLWTNFVKYGNPTPQTSELLPVEWTSTSANEMSYLNLDYELSLGDVPFKERSAFLDQLFKKYWTLQRGYSNATNTVPAEKPSVFEKNMPNKSPNSALNLNEPLKKITGLLK